MRASRVVTTVLGALVVAGTSAAVAPGTPAPAFTQTDPAHWVNSPPLSLAALRGQVVLVEFWAFDCVNCLQSLPWLHALYERYRNRGLIVVGVHTPELARERIAENVRGAVRSLDIRYPVMIDDDYAYWQAIGNRYWPAFYLVDRAGSIRVMRIGETHPGDANATALENAIAGELGTLAR